MLLTFIFISLLFLHTHMGCAFVPLRVLWTSYTENALHPRNSYERSAIPTIMQTCTKVCKCMHFSNGAMDSPPWGLDMCQSGKAGNNSALASYVVEYLARKLPLKLIVSHLTPVSNVKVRVNVPNKKKKTQVESSSA